MDKAQIIEAIEQMNVLELAELVKELEEKFGVSAAAPVAVAAAPAAGGVSSAGGAAIVYVLAGNGWQRRGRSHRRVHLCRRGR